MDATFQVLMWWLLFAGSHTVLSQPPLRDRLVSRLGMYGFQGLYSLIAFATFVPLVWIFFAHRSASAVPLPALTTTPGLAWLTIALMLFAVLLLVLGLVRPSPASLIPTKSGAAARGALRITRHPVFMAAAVLGLAHLLVNHSAIDRAFFGGLVLYSLLGSAHQDWRKRREADPAMQAFFAETSFLPFLAIAAGRNRPELREFSFVGILLGLAAFALLFVFHHRVFT